MPFSSACLASVDAWSAMSSSANAIRARFAAVNGAAGAGLLDLGNAGGVLADDLVGVWRRAPGRRRAASREQVLRAVGETGEQSALLFRDRGVGPFRFVERALRHECGDRVVRRSELSEEVERRASELDRGDASLAERRAELRRRTETNFGEAQSALKTVGGSVSMGMRCA